MSTWKDSRKQLEDVYFVFGHIYNGTHRTSEAWKVYRSRCKRTGIPFELSRVHVVDLITDNCFYCTAVPNPTNGIDRVDNIKGYTEDNVVTCCIRCNKAKNNSSLDEFENWAIRLGNNLTKWKQPVV